MKTGKRSFFEEDNLAMKFSTTRMTTIIFFMNPPVVKVVCCNKVSYRSGIMETMIRDM